LPSELSHFCFVSSLVSFLFKFRPETISRILQLGNVEWYRAPDKSVKAIITPHAAYDNSGATAAFGFCQIDAQEIDRVFMSTTPRHLGIYTLTLHWNCIRTEIYWSLCWLVWYMKFPSSQLVCNFFLVIIVLVVIFWKSCFSRCNVLETLFFSFVTLRNS